MDVRAQSLSSHPSSETFEPYKFPIIEGSKISVAIEYADIGCFDENAYFSITIVFGLV